MKTQVILCTAALAFLLTAAGNAQAGKTSLEYGKSLFSNPELGGSTNDKSCNSCHADGEKLAAAAANPKLAELINKCITGPMLGEKIDGRSAEMRSLKLYLQSLSPQKEE